MKKRITFSILLLFLAIGFTACEKNRGCFAKNIPECIKQSIKEDTRIIRAEEYCNTDKTKKIYHLIKKTIAPGIIMNDENCNVIPVQTETFKWVLGKDDDWALGYLRPDGTVEYDGDIYHFKRVIFRKI